MDRIVLGVAGFLVLVAIKWLLNNSKKRQLERFLEDYNRYLKEVAKPNKDVDPPWWFLQKKPTIIRLFKEALLSDSVLPHVEPLGFGKISYENVSIWDNMQVSDSRVATRVTSHFHEAIGVYRERRDEALRPGYWIEAVVFLPQRIASYLGGNAENAVVKLAQVIYWLVSFALGVIGLRAL